MSRWTQDRSVLLSLLLDNVTGSQEVVANRQDFCRLYDCTSSNFSKSYKQYFTGSKAEGLDLPGSDVDYMMDINDTYNIKVVQSLHPTPATLHPSPTTLPYCVFYFCTKNTPPGFALLCSISPVFNIFLNGAMQSEYGQHYLSSNLMAHIINQYYPLDKGGFYTKIARQGPSLEHWSIIDDPEKSGTDVVPSIHCAFWPDSAKEWIKRPRPFGWPMTNDVLSIINFGCHLVPIGHPHSEKSTLEWRISFSVAERTLVWSFNHVQIQCYAVMKIILKEFIKENCTPNNQVLCSYFIKTFLFWKYKTKEISFWQKKNFRECIKYLLIEFNKCLHEGVIRHFFCPRFNLLSVKLTQEARIELLQLFDIIIQSDISILRECQTLKNVWSRFLSADRNQIYIIHNEHRRNFLINDEVMMDNLICLKHIIHGYIRKCFSGLLCQINILSSQYPKSDLLLLDQIINQILNLPCKTCLKSLVIKEFVFDRNARAMNSLCLENKFVYRITAHEKSLAFDLSTCALWHAIVLLMKQEYTSTLRILNQLSCSIPPYAITKSYAKFMKDQEPEQLPCSSRLYVDKFLNSEYSTVATQNVVTLQNVVITTFCLALALASIGKM